MNLWNSNFFRSAMGFVILRRLYTCIALHVCRLRATIFLVLLWQQHSLAGKIELLNSQKLTLSRTFQLTDMSDAAFNCQ